MKASTIKPIMLLFVAVATSTMLKAQTENTSERLLIQLMNGTAPGLQFSSEKPAVAPVTANKLNQKEGLVTQIKKGTAPGMQFKRGGGSSAPVMARATTAAPAQPLPSEKPVAKPELVKPAAAVLPKQE